MERGSYIAASGGVVQFQKLEVLNNNLANVSTPGFKKQIVSTEQERFEDTLASATAGKDPFARDDQDRTPGVRSVKTATDFSLGPIENTGNPLDVALRNPNDFFVVEVDGEAQYTRAGNFTINAAGQLSTQDGATVSGDGGALTADGAGALINPDGSLNVNGSNVGRLQVVRFEDPAALERVGSSRFKLPAGVQAPESVEPQLVGQALERSNVSAVNAMVDLIVANRAFQLYTRSAESIDAMNQGAINQIGRSR